MNISEQEYDRLKRIEAVAKNCEAYLAVSKREGTVIESILHRDLKETLTPTEKGEG